MWRDRYVRWQVVGGVGADAWGMLLGLLPIDEPARCRTWQYVR